MTRSHLLHIASACGLLLVESVAAADYPTRPIRLVVPYLAGGAADVIGRNYAEAMGGTLGQSLVIENRSGGGGLPAAEAVARAAPDGYTLVVSGIASHVLAPAVAKVPPFDPVRDFTHVAYFAGSPDVLVVHPAAPYKTFADLVAAGREDKAGIQFVSPGQGSAGHVAAEYLAGKTGMKLTHVAYRGGGGAVIDLIAGHVKLGSLTLTTALEHIRAGSLIALGVTAERRVEALPELATLKELGHPDMIALTWFGLSGPAGLPPEIVDRLSRAALSAQQRPALQQVLKRQGIELEAMSPQQFTAFMAAEVAKWGSVVKGIAKPE